MGCAFHSCDPNLNDDYLDDIVSKCGFCDRRAGGGNASLNWGRGDFSRP